MRTWLRNMVGGGGLLGSWQGVRILLPTGEFKRFRHSEHPVLVLALTMDDAELPASAAPLLSTAASAEPPPLPPLSTIGSPVRVVASGGHFFMWDIEEVARLRVQRRLAVTAIGSCAVKTSTRGKAAALPVMLSDEEVCALVAAGWAAVVDASGGPLPDVAGALAAQVAAEPWGARALRRAAFRDLWARGYCLTNGIKFGCDYLCYRDDPTAVHAAFMVVVLREGCGVRTLSLTAVARVATTALKIAVVAWVDPGRGTVRYAAFKRMGPGSAVFRDGQAAAAGGGEEGAGGEEGGGGEGEEGGAGAAEGR